MQQKKTILVVDDEEKITEVLQSYLDNADYRVVCAHSGVDFSVNHAGGILFAAAGLGLCLQSEEQL